MNTTTCTVAEEFSIMELFKKINYAVHKGTGDNADVALK
jgi:hypothetical protein